MVKVAFENEEVARRVLWRAAKNLIDGSLKVRFKENDRDRIVVAMDESGLLNEVNDGSAGEFELDEAVFYEDGSI